MKAHDFEVIINELEKLREENPDNKEDYDAAIADTKNVQKSIESGETDWVKIAGRTYFILRAMKWTV